MGLTSIKFFLCRNDVKIVIIGTVTGGILQVISRQYLKNHPEFLKDDAPVIKKKSRLPRFLLPHGGAFFEISGISIRIIGQVVINFLAENGLLAGTLSSCGILIGKIPARVISNYLRDAFPQNLPHLEKKRFMLVNGEKIYLDQCDQNLKFLFNLLEDPDLPFEEKERITRKVLVKYLDLRTLKGRVTFTLCIVFILYILSIQNPSGFYIVMKNLTKAIREGKISKAVGRLIVRRLKKKGVVVDPELLEVVT